ncbi:MAG: MBL fold metallo-hydrolase [Deltaproteobacteria bacterium]|nr:MBL fold metallo-hydrolase [Deltaproteobacteria bacterium]
MILTFLGTGGAWIIPELACECMICKAMRQKGEQRTRTSLLLSGGKNLLVDCTPDAAVQLSRHGVRGLDAVLITHEHGDHYLGLDELYSFKRALPRGEYEPIPVYVTAKSWEAISLRFDYLVSQEVIEVVEVIPGRDYQVGDFRFSAFKTNHGPFALGSVGYVIRWKDVSGNEKRLVYTSDFDDLPETHPDIHSPDFLVIPALWFNEPEKNIPHQMSFQRAVGFIKLWQPRKETFIVHIGDGDPVPGDPANNMLKKRKPLGPLSSPVDGNPYPVPLIQDQWQEVVERVIRELSLPFKVTVAHDGLSVEI